MSFATRTSRISWPAIFASMVIVLAFQLLFGLIGLSVGAGNVNPATESHPFQGIGAGLAIWIGLTTLLSLFAGGWVAARLAGVSQKVDGILHGVVGWGLATLATTFLLGTAAGGILRTTSGLATGLAGIVGQGATAVGQQLGAVLPAGSVDVADLKKEARTLLRQTGKPELRPNRLETSASRAASDVKETAGDVAQHPQLADSEVDGLFDRLFRSAEGAVDAADRDAVVNVVMARSHVSRAEAESTVTEWQQTFNQAKSRIAAVAAQASAKAREVGQAAADATAKAAGWTAALLFLGMIAAAFGGFVGTWRKQNADVTAMLNGEAQSPLIGMRSAS